MGSNRSRRGETGRLVIILLLGGIVFGAALAWREYRRAPNHPDLEAMARELKERIAEGAIIGESWSADHFDQLSDFGGVVAGSSIEQGSEDVLIEKIRDHRPYPPLFTELSDARLNAWGEHYFVRWEDKSGKQFAYLIEVGQTYAYPLYDNWERRNIYDGDFYCIYVVEVSLEDNRLEDMKYNWYKYYDGDDNAYWLVDCIVLFFIASIVGAFFVEFILILDRFIISRQA